jgi:diacylglycerol kinase (ATP)
MRTFALVYNLSCGTKRQARRRLEDLRYAFRIRGVDLRTYCTSAPSCASAVVRAAMSSGCEAVLAAGGDGTFNELLQAAMLEPNSLPLGIVPFGSGNVLAQEVGVGGDVSHIAEQIVHASPTRVPVGLLSCVTDGAGARRYFTVAAGIGADARVICGVNLAWKKHLGIGAYYTEALRQLLFSPKPMPLFRARFTDLHTGEPREITVSQLIVERVGYFSSPLITGNGTPALLSDTFRLILFRTQQRNTFFRYGIRLLARRFGATPGAIANVEVVHAASVICEPLPGMLGEEVLTEVDGEMVGGLPATLTLLPGAIQLMLPTPRTELHNSV